MKSFELKGTLRTSLGKKDAKILRRNKMVPCVMYGGKENYHFSASISDFKNLIYTNHVYVVNVDLNGKVHPSVMKEIQFHPVSDVINHIDFVEVDANKPIEISLPVEITGNSEGIRAGGKLRQRKKYVKVKGMIKDLPDTLVVDISELKIGDSILAGDIKYEQIEVMEAHHNLVVGVVSSRIAKGMEEGAESIAATAATAATAAAAATAAEAAAAAAEPKK
jgi:large subunit ribosomal protein L25